MSWFWREYMRNWKTKLFFSIGVVIIFAALSAATVKFFLDSAVAPVKAPGNAKQNTTPVPLENGSTLPGSSPSAHHSHYVAPTHTYTPAPTRTYTFRPKPTPTRTYTPTSTPTPTPATSSPAPTPTVTTPTPTGTSTDATPSVPAVPGSTPGF